MVFSQWTYKGFCIQCRKRMKNIIFIVGGQSGTVVRDHDDPSYYYGGRTHWRRKVSGHQHLVSGSDQVRFRMLWLALLPLSFTF